jgi:hypothetical protein
MNQNPVHFHSKFKEFQQEIFRLDSDSLFDFISRANVILTTKIYLDLILGKNTLNERVFLFSFVIYRFPYEVFEQEYDTELYTARMNLIASTKNLLETFYAFQKNLDSVSLRNSFESNSKIYTSHFLLWKDLNKTFVVSQAIHKLNKINELGKYTSIAPLMGAKKELHLILELNGIKTQEQIENFPLKKEFDESSRVPVEQLRKEITYGNFESVIIYITKMCNLVDIPFDPHTFTPDTDSFTSLFRDISQKVFKTNSPELVQFKELLHSDISNLVPHFIDTVMKIVSN